MITLKEIIYPKCYGSASCADNNKVNVGCVDDRCKFASNCVTLANM